MRPLHRPRSGRTRLIGTITALTMGAGAFAATAAAAPASVETESTNVTDDVTEGLVHRFKPDETTGTGLANPGSSDADATLVDADRATLPGQGVGVDPHDYTYSEAGPYSDLHT